MNELYFTKTENNALSFGTVKYADCTSAEG